MLSKLSKYVSVNNYFYTLGNNIKRGLPFVSPMRDNVKKKKESLLDGPNRLILKYFDKLI